MATAVSADTRHDLLRAVHARYRAGTKDDKLRILDQVVAITGLSPEAPHSAHARAA